MSLHWVVAWVVAVATCLIGLATGSAYAYGACFAANFIGFVFIVGSVLQYRRERRSGRQLSDHAAQRESDRLADWR